MTLATKLTALAAVVLLAAGCTAQADHSEHPMSESVTMTNQWSSSADSGMAAVFGSFANTGHHDAVIVSGESPVAGHVEVHEVVPDATGAKTMRPKEGGLTIAAGETRELIPGGDHLMLMDVKQPLQPGAEVALTVIFEDGSTLPVTAQVRDFAGANEEYVPSGEPGGPHHHG